MASPAQIDANRLNSQKSTGPRTVEGKTSSSHNALRHGLYSDADVIAGEDPEERAQLEREYLAHFRPAGPEEAHLVRVLIASDWRQRRYRRIESATMNRLLSEMDEPDVGALFASPESSRLLDRIFRAAQSLHRAWSAALAELERLVSRRMSVARMLAARKRMEKEDAASEDFGLTERSQNNKPPASITRREASRIP